MGCSVKMREMLNATVSICSPSLGPFLPFHILPRYLITLTGIVLNFFLLVGMIMDPLKCFRNSSSYLIMNIAASDILACSSSFLFLRWRPCTMRYVIHRLFKLGPYISNVSTFTVACDRYMSCIHPFKYRAVITRRVALAVILLQSLFCAAHVVFDVFFVNAAFISRSVVAVLVLLSTASLYARSAYVLKVNSRYLNDATAVSPNSQGRITQSARLVNEKRLLTTMLLVTLITVTTFVPLTVYVNTTGTSNDIDEIWADILAKDFYHIWFGTLFLVNFSVNPLIYVWRLRNFRETFRRLVVCDCLSRRN
jgi:hypothetical protein